MSPLTRGHVILQLDYESVDDNVFACMQWPTVMTFNLHIPFLATGGFGGADSCSVDLVGSFSVIVFPQNFNSEVKCGSSCL